jgi:hypothetical protein
MRRRSRSTADSLDLLLDTVCNAFGGVVFISILIIVLLNLTSAQQQITPPTPAAEAELLTLQSTAVERQSQLKTLREGKRRLDRVADEFVDRDARFLIVQREELRSDNEELESDRADVMSAIASGQTRINRIARALAALERKEEQARSELEDAQRSLAAEVAMRTRTSKLPRQRTTDKQLVAFLLKGGRLCSVFRLEQDGRLVHNDLECRLEDRADGSQSVAPRADAGLKVELGAVQQPAIAQRLARFDRGRHFVAVVVWPDSFAHFEVVKRAIVASRFEYQLIPWPDPEPLLIGSPKGPQRVQ